MPDENDALACPRCWKNRRPCSRKTAHNRCMNCNHQVIRGNNDAKSTIECSRPFPGDDIDHQFRSCGWDQASSSLKDLCDDLNILDLDIRSATASPGHSPSRVDISLNFHGSLTNNAVGMASLEAAILENFSSKLKSKVGDSDLISCSVLAGALLHVLCSAHDIRGQIRTFKDGIPTMRAYSEQNLTLDFRRVLASTVGKHMETVMNAIRSTNLGVDHNSLCAYAAAALLHFEVDHFARSMRNGDLSTEIPLGLEGPFLDWLKSIDMELKNRVIEGCGEFSAWTSLIEGSRKSSRRQHDPLTIFIHLAQHKVDSPTLQKAIPLPRLSNNSTPVGPNPQVTPPLPDTGPRPQPDLTCSSEASFSMYGELGFSAEESLSQQASHSFIGYAPDFHAFYQELDPLFHDPGISDMLGNPTSDFTCSSKEISEIRDLRAQSSTTDLLTQSRVNAMTSNRQTLDPSVILQNRHPYSLHMRL